MNEKPEETEALPSSARSKVKLGDLERPRLDNTLYTAPSKPPDTIGTDPDDGLPRPFASTSLQDAQAPAMAPATFVCMADTSLFVVRNRAGEIVGRFAPEHVSRGEDGRYRVDVWLALECRVPFRDVFRFRVGRWCVVEPLRPQCQHYRRQLRPWGPDHPGKHQCIRYCSAITDEHGEMVSLNDETLLACEMRTPQDPTTVRLIDEFDAGVVAAGAAADFDEEEFDVDAELAKGAGIFSTEGG